ncbi:hypothetical protein [Rhodopirellula sp. MGV]|uniref:hypothetical protein n=1 Tax=Rhodopirellula sp. MGV TaxID=2023130 RepID=UPI000B96DA3C|nr:hypothetical protein [Rhodopirellula sp. MGV]OYP28235.1 hypothetical protein CGZ80_27335 [Rhodopirellula sp. MGV]PNY34237.1 hypothetical protein C2E31_24420 [Rhodopirellula baltica]
MLTPESFQYVHRPCGQSTLIDGPEFQAVSNPLSGIETTVCAHCGEQDDIENFAWEGSSETIGQYYRRHLAHIPPQEKARADRSAMFKYLIVGGAIGIAAGIATGLLTAFFSTLAGLIIGAVATIAFATLGVLVGFMHFENKIVASVIERYLGVEDARQLVALPPNA